MMAHLWSGEKSILRRFFKRFIKSTLPSESKKFRREMTNSEIQKLIHRLRSKHPHVSQICSVVIRNISDVHAARLALLEIEALLRTLDASSGTHPFHFSCESDFNRRSHSGCGHSPSLRQNTNILFSRSQLQRSQFHLNCPISIVWLRFYFETTQRTS